MLLANWLRSSGWVRRSGHGASALNLGAYNVSPPRDPHRGPLIHGSCPTGRPPAWQSVFALARRTRDRVQDAQFAPLFPSRGQPAEVPWRLALVTVLQFAEKLSDRRAAEAVRGRIDWTYLLGLELADPGFDASVLSEFRTR